MLNISIIILLLCYNSLSPPPPITYLPHTHTHTQFFGNPGCSNLSKSLWQILPSQTHQSSQSAQGVKKKKTASSLVWMTLGNLYDLGQKKNLWLLLWASPCLTLSEMDWLEALNLKNGATVTQLPTLELQVKSRPWSSGADRKTGTPQLEPWPSGFCLRGADWGWGSPLVVSKTRP